MFGFRSKSKSKPTEPQQPSVSIMKNPCGRDKIDNLISLEAKLNQSKITEDIVMQLLALYSVASSQAESRRILRHGGRSYQGVLPRQAAIA